MCEGERGRPCRGFYRGGGGECECLKLELLSVLIHSFASTCSLCHVALGMKGCLLTDNSIHSSLITHSQFMELVRLNESCVFLCLAFGV